MWLCCSQAIQKVWNRGKKLEQNANYEKIKEQYDISNTSILTNFSQGDISRYMFERQNNLGMSENSINFGVVDDEKNEEERLIDEIQEVLSGLDQRNRKLIVQDQPEPDLGLQTSANLSETIGQNILNQFSTEELEDQLLRELSPENHSSYQLSLDDKDLKLQIYWKTKQIEKFNINILKSVWQLENASVSQILSFLMDIESQRQVDKQISIYERIRAIEDNVDLLYLQYKKVLFASPRDFLYIRYFKYLDQEQKKLIVVTKSVQSDEIKPEIKDTIRGDIILAGYLIEELSNESVQITSYNEANAKISISNAIVKPAQLNQFKQFVTQFNKSIPPK